MDEASDAMAILMIEDEYLVAADIKFYLERAGWREVTHAATEADALAAIQTGTWQAAVVDANLNGVGIERIAEALHETGVPYVVVTGYGRTGLPTAIAEAPVIEKPFRPQALVDTVTRLCAQRAG